MTTAEPLVSVLMPAYNSAPFIGAAIESILAQTYRNFELLVIDDGSLDETGAIVAALCDRDRRVSYTWQEHAGRVAGRNSALALAQGDYLAWLDADDIARPQRLEWQAQCLGANPGFIIVGSAYQEMDISGQPQRIHRMPASDTLIRWHCLFHSPFAQSSVMLRRDVLRLYNLCYDPAMKEAEDYDLWSRLLNYGRAFNFSEPLLDYRVYPTQASQLGREALLEYAGRISQRNLAELGVPLPIAQVARLREWYDQFPGRFAGTDRPLAQAFLDILDAFSALPGLDAAEVQPLRGRWLGRLARAALRSGDSGWYGWLARRLNLADFRSILAYLGVREKL